MRRYLVDKESFKDGTVYLEGDTFHHICEVCRQGIGSQFEVLTEDGKAFLVEIKVLQKKSATAIILDQRQLPQLKRPHLHLRISVPKFSTFEAVLEKAVELGVKSVQPFFSDFSFVKNPAILSGSKWARWEKIIKSAVQQSGRGEPLTLQKPVTFQELLKSINPNSNELHLFAYEGETPTSIKTALHQIRQGPEAPEDIYIYVGSEGGFSRQEVMALQKIGLRPVTLGDQVLRVETACLSLISILKYEYSE